MLAAREVGPATIAVLVGGLAVLWALAKPSGEPFGSYVGQWFGAESVLLLSIALVLISTLPWVESWFDGIDRAAVWHRRLAIAGMGLFAPHILLSSGKSSAVGAPLAVVATVGMIALVVWAVLPRWQSVAPAPLRGLVLDARELPAARTLRRLFGGYERWRSVHRTTGLFVTAAFVHGLLQGTPFDGSALLHWTYVAIGAVGTGFYLYRELLARFLGALHDYEVDTVQPLGAGLTEIVLRPLGRPVQFTAGQFAMVYLEAKDGWHRHPFTITSAPHESQIRVTVKASGDYTSRLGELVEPGMPAVIGGPHGRFDYRRGTRHQLWVAGGVGVAPFLSWLRALEDPLPTHIDFFYSSDGPAPFAEEIGAIARGHPSLRVHLHDTSRQGRLRTTQMLEQVHGRPSELSVFMCGPQGMLRSFQRELRTAGTPSRRIYREYFDWR